MITSARLSVLVVMAWLLPLVAQANAPLVVWHSYRGREAEALQAQAKAFAAPNEVLVVAIPADTLSDKVGNAIALQQGPDLVVAAHEKIQEWRHGLRAVTWAEPSDLKAVRDALTLDGQPYAFPYALKTLCVLHRRHDQLSDLSLASLKSLVGAHTKSDSLAGFALGFDTREFYFVAPFVLPLSPLLAGSRLELGAAEPALLWLRQVLGSGLVPRSMSHARLKEEFEAGRIKTWLTGPWALAELSEHTLNELQVSPIPPLPLSVPGEGGSRAIQPKPFLTVDAVFVLGSASAAAMPVAAALASPSAALERAERAMSVPPFAAQLPSGSLLSAFVTQAQSAVAMPTGRAMSSAWVPLQRMVEGVTSSEADIASLIAAATLAHQTLLSPVQARGEWLLAGGLVLGGVAGCWWLLRRRRQARDSAAPPVRAQGPLGSLLVLLGPAAALGSLFVLLPLVFGLLLCLFDFSDGRAALTEGRFVGLGNFAHVFLSPGFWQTLAVTVLWTAANLAITVALGMLLGLLLHDQRVWKRAWWRVLLVLPWAVPSYISALAFCSIFDFERGALNALLRWLSVAPVDWFSRFTTAFTANLVTNVWLGFPFMMVMTLGALQSIPKEQQEAMRLDGATPWQTFVHLTLPSIIPVMAPSLLLSTAWTFNMFNVVYLVSGGAPRGETDILVSEAYRWAFERGNRYGLAAAYCVIIALLLAGFLRLFQRREAR